MTRVVPDEIPMRPEPDPEFVRLWTPYPSARSAFAAFLRAVPVDRHEFVLLPSYVGWSAREGSGVFDPVRETGVRHAFYRLDQQLQIDLEDLERRLQRHHPRVVVLIHYFGWPDPSYPEAVRLAHESGALVLEDGAHALLSDVVGGVVGRLGDASIWSLHKLLPVNDGGMLVLNRTMHTLADRLHAAAPPGADPWRFDLARLAEIRRRNASRLAAMLPAIADEAEPLWTSLPAGVVPQTYPILIRHASRDRLYDTLNAAGFGVVSLYHTLIGEIDSADYPDAHRLARTILNLPVHESAPEASLERLVTLVAEHAAGQRRP